LGELPMAEQPSTRSKVPQKLIIFRGSAKKMLPPSPTPAMGSSSSNSSMSIWGLENQLHKKIIIAQKYDPYGIITVQPGEKKEINWDFPLQIKLGKSSQDNEQYDITGEGSWKWSKVHVVHTYARKMAITNVIWHDTDTHTGSGLKYVYNIVLQRDEETKRVMFLLFNNAVKELDRDFEIGFDGLLDWNNQKSV
jgi:hypothetical protein